MRGSAASDLLVGLHVWPTTNLKDVGEVLNRDDLAELNPLKFYVLRRQETVAVAAVKSSATHSETQENDIIVTGRIAVSLDNQRTMHGRDRPGLESPNLPWLRQCRLCRRLYRPRQRPLKLLHH